MSYAQHTTVPIDRSQGEIRKILEKHSATGFMFGETGDKAIIAFEIERRRIKFILPLPVKPRDLKAIAVKRHEQALRSRWRCLTLAIKAKLECVETGIETLEQAFLAHIVLPNGKTMGEVSIPQIASAYHDNKMPPLLGYDNG